MKETKYSKADLHIHTNVSDGVLSPDELLRMVKNSGISVIAVTDHDSVAALDTIHRRAERFSIQTVSGVELSTEFNGKELHFLGYCIEHHSKRFLDYLYLFRRRRYQCAQEIVEKLWKSGIRIKLEQVVRIAGNGPIGRPHIADVMTENGWTASRDEAFSKYLYNGGPFYVEKYCITAPEVLDLIHSIGGAVFLAHPGISCPDETIKELIPLGLDGIEIIHPKHTAEMVAHYTAAADELSLLISGGSDFHGDSPDEPQIGEYAINSRYVEEIASYCERKRSEWNIQIDTEEETDIPDDETKESSEYELNND